MSQAQTHYVRVYRWTGDITGAGALTETVHMFRVHCPLERIHGLCGHFRHQGLRYETTTVDWLKRDEVTA